MGNLISKKELLLRYNISYGTLYRWKRMGLIPDDWLVKKSTYTGQETFFVQPLRFSQAPHIPVYLPGIH